MQFERKYDLINGKFRELLAPSIMLALSNNLAVLIDAILISYFLGNEYLAIVQICSPFIIIISLLYWMIGNGGSILCSIANSNMDTNKANRIFTVSLVSIVLLTIFCAILFLFYSDATIKFLCSDASLRPLVYQYYFFLVLTLPFISYTICMSFFIKYYGFIKLQANAFIMANVLNIIFDIIFMKFLNFGIAGASLAMLAGFICSSIYISSYFFNAKKSLKFIKVKASIFVKDLLKICKFGFSTSSQYLYLAIKLYFINSLLILFPPAGLESLNICDNFLMLMMIFVIALIESIIPIVSVYFEEEDYMGVRYICKKILKLIFIISLSFTVVLFIFPEISLYVFPETFSEEIPYILNALRLFALSFVFYAINIFYLYYCQAVQYSKLANVISLLEGLIFPVFFAYLLSYFLDVNGIWIAFILTESLVSIILFIYSKYISKKTNNKYSGFFLIPRSRENVFEYTIHGNIEEVSSLCEIVQKSLINSKISEVTSQTIKEMLVNIININDEIDLIDIIINAKNESVVFSIKYAGILYNPNEDENLDKNSILYDIKEGFESSYILELNNLQITINNFNC